MTTVDLYSLTLNIGVQLYSLIISTHMKNMSQIETFPQIGVKTNKKYVKPPPRYLLMVNIQYLPEFP